MPDLSPVYQELDELSETTMKRGEFTPWKYLESFEMLEDDVTEGD